MQQKRQVEFEIQGEPASKANSRRIVKMGGRLLSIKSQKALNYVVGFKAQCPTVKPPLEGDLAVDIDIWYASRRPDLDESLILDAMQGFIYSNDRQVKEKHIRHFLDKNRPRAKILVREI